MSTDKIEKQIQFILEIDKLKQIQRRSYLTDGKRVENTAEHSWHVATLAMIVVEYAVDDIDINKVIKMLLIHDIVEIDAGDTFCYDEIGALDKKEREIKAADRIFNLLPFDQAKDLRSLWEEFEDAKTNEAKFAVAIDRFMPILHNCQTQGKSWKEHKVVKSQVLKRNIVIKEGSEKLWEYVIKIIEDSVKKGYLAEDIN